MFLTSISHFLQVIFVTFHITNVPEVTGVARMAMYVPEVHCAYLSGKIKKNHDFDGTLNLLIASCVELRIQYSDSWLRKIYGTCWEIVKKICNNW